MQLSTEENTGMIVFDENDFKENDKFPWKFLEQHKHGLNAGLFLSSPYPVAIATASYLLFVCYLGPKVLMAKRAPFRMATIIRFYNLAMVLASFLLHIRLLKSINGWSNFLDCSRTFNFQDGSSDAIATMGNFIITIRVIEFLDTIFFALRKKTNQMTFLHIFHHAFVPPYAYWILRTAPVRFNVFIITMNSIIHIIMYSYYYLSTYDQAKYPLVRKLLWFKRYMTQMQIMQFVMIAIYTMWIFNQPDHCQVRLPYIASTFLISTGFLTLFMHFYTYAYKQSRLTEAKRLNASSDITKSTDSIGANNIRATPSSSGTGVNSLDKQKLKELLASNSKYYNEPGFYEKKHLL